MIDLRSDTVTRPTPAMLAAMTSAKTGDDVYGEDPTVNELEQTAAELTGKEAAIFATSGTQGNLLGLLSHCERGHEYIVGTTAHTYRYEGGGAAVLGGIQPCPIPFNARGELPLEAIGESVKPDDSHFAISRLVCLENTQAGKVLALDYLREYSDLVTGLGLRRHLDGARVFNAAVALDVPVRDICQHFDTVSICLSKGLGCPMGSLLVGDQATIARARRWRKMLGGGLRQAGVVAAAGLHALHHHIDDLAQDHDNARRLATGLQAIDGFRLAEEPQTNMVMLDASMDMAPLQPLLTDAGIRISGHRWVLHRDISAADVDTILGACERFARA